ncbi:MAG: class I SAM-dependent methyltransferase [Candidatus Aenigmarchaeota archaeon]|nr:class I SAM-dependent methyltransferase [Candidatus Aenigmarchaeota archaeon]
MGKMKPPQTTRKDPQSYETEWRISADRIAEVGLYKRIFDPYGFEGKNILELGTGPGRETEEIWRKNPNLVLGLEIKPPMLKLAKEYLIEKGYPVNITGTQRYSGIPSFNVREGEITLAQANYLDPKTIDPRLRGKFDYAILTFPGGGIWPVVNCDPEEGIYPLAVAMEKIGYLVKPGGKAISADRVFSDDLAERAQDVAVPSGFRLVGAKCIEDREGVKATVWGNKSASIYAGGKKKRYPIKNAKPGEVAEVILKEMDETDAKPGILTLEFEKL